jgi:hypothetical protein
MATRDVKGSRSDRLENHRLSPRPALPPGLIWVEKITEETPVFATSSPTGRSNDEIGLS